MFESVEPHGISVGQQWRHLATAVPGGRKHSSSDSRRLTVIFLVAWEEKEESKPDVGKLVVQFINLCRSDC